MLEPALKPRPMASWMHHNVFDLMLLGLAHKGHKVDMNVILFLRNLKRSCNYRTDEEIDPVHVARLGVQRLLSPDLANQNSWEGTVRSTEEHTWIQHQPDHGIILSYNVGGFFNLLLN